MLRRNISRQVVDAARVGVVVLLRSVVATSVEVVVLMHRFVVTNVVDAFKQNIVAKQIAVDHAARQVGTRVLRLKINFAFNQSQLSRRHFAPQKLQI